jgi:hypothetical protein
MYKHISWILYSSSAREWGRNRGNQPPIFAMRYPYMLADIVVLYRLRYFLPQNHQRYATFALVISWCDHRPSTDGDTGRRVDGEMILSTCGGTP